MVQNSFKKKQSFVKKLNEQLKKNEEEIENRVQLIELRNARLAVSHEEFENILKAFSYFIPLFMVQNKHNLTILIIWKLVRMSLRMKE